MRRGSEVGVLVANASVCEEEWSIFQIIPKPRALMTTQRFTVVSRSAISHHRHELCGQMTMANASSMDTSFVHLSSHPTMEDHEANKLSRRNLQSPVELEPDEYSPVPRSASDGDGLHVVVTAGPVHRESHTRSLVKGLTWRVLATTTTTVSKSYIVGARMSSTRHYG